MLEWDARLKIRAALRQAITRQGGSSSHRLRARHHATKADRSCQRSGNTLCSALLRYVPVRVLVLALLCATPFPAWLLPLRLQACPFRTSLLLPLCGRTGPLGRSTPVGRGAVLVRCWFRFGFCCGPIECGGPTSEVIRPRLVLHTDFVFSMRLGLSSVWVGVALCCLGGLVSGCRLWACATSKEHPPMQPTTRLELTTRRKSGLAPPMLQARVPKKA